MTPVLICIQFFPSNITNLIPHITDLTLVNHKEILQCRLQQAEVSLAKALFYKMMDVHIYLLCDFHVRFVIFPQITS